MLSSQLSELECSGIVKRKEYPQSLQKLNIL
ncbi:MULTISPECIES: hypothetical protein [Bacillus]